MFSCCRANTKNSSTKTTKKDKQNKSNENCENEDTKAVVGGNRDKKLIIPTINIENGKANENADDQTSAADADAEEKRKAMTLESFDTEIEDANLYRQQLPENIASESTTATTTAVMSPSSDIAAEVADIVAPDENRLNDEYNEDLEEKSHSQPRKATLTSSSSISPQSASDNGAEVADTLFSQSKQKSFEAPLTHDENQTSTAVATSVVNATDHPPKSCLSRHNSTHISIKKKVNISSHAEIIEPDPLPPPPFDHSSLGDDDEVFSDSLPPPKRDSMCAPYIERSGISDALPETIAFAHGLPEWFNDERIHDIGCIEPPVTPVGRDELEMKRQRLYAELLRAAQAAVEHSVRFTPLSADAFSSPWKPNVNGYAPTAAPISDCDPDLKPSVAENLEYLVNRLEKLVERLERSVSARELEIANRTFDSVLEKKRESFDFESTDLPPLPVENISDQLNQRIERLETTLNRINDRHSSSRSASISQNSQQQQLKEGSLENIPTVLEDYQEEPLPLPSPPPSMSVYGYQDIISGPLSQYLALSAKIGGDVATHAQFVKAAFDAQLQYVTLATQCAQPSQDKQMDLLKPTSAQISAIQEYREKNRASPYFNHLSAISESIPALGWVCVSPTPGPHVKEMNDAGQFYTNRVLKEWKEKDAKHVEWARAWVQTLTELQAYIKQYHTTGLVWSGKGAPAASAVPPPPPPIGACPPPPPPPAFDLAAMSLDGSGAPDERSALFAEINQGEGITKNLKKVTADMQTHKNPTLRTGPAPFKTPTGFGSANSAPSGAPVVKEPVFMRDGKKWIIEHQKNNSKLLVENAEMNNVVYMFKCEGSTLTVKGKVNNVVLDSCKKCSLLFDSVVASIEFVNCQSVQMQVLGFVPTISIDKTDGCQMYLSKDSLGVEIVSSKSSEMNVMLPESTGDYTELALPEQFKTTISGKALKTVCVDSLG